MPLFYFDLRDGCGNVLDQEGTDLPDLEAARNHALAVARDLLGNELSNSHWCLEVRDRNRNELFTMPFSEADETIQHLNGETRKLIERIRERRLACAETVFNSRMALLGAQAALARAKSRPHLATENGRVVLPHLKPAKR